MDTIFICSVRNLHVNTASGMQISFLRNHTNEIGISTAQTCLIFSQTVRASIYAKEILKSIKRPNPFTIETNSQIIHVNFNGQSTLI